MVDKRVSYEIKNLIQFNNLKNLTHLSVSLILNFCVILINFTLSLSRPLLKFCTLTRVKGLVYKGCERVLKLPLKNFLDKKNSSENLEFNFFIYFSVLN